MTQNTAALRIGREILRSWGRGRNKAYINIDWCNHLMCDGEWPVTWDDVRRTATMLACVMYAQDVAEGRHR